MGVEGCGVEGGVGTLNLGFGRALVCLPCGRGSVVSVARRSGE
jgi:hypothetical protein